MRITIVGHGFVGHAIEQAFKGSGTRQPGETEYTYLNDITIIDPKYEVRPFEPGMTNVVALEDIASTDPELIFIAVPTPRMPDGTCDASIVFDVLSEIVQRFPKDGPVVVLNSTVTPTILESCRNMYQNFVFNPEFLTEANADADFVNAPFHIFGGPKYACQAVHRAYHRSMVHIASVPVYHTDLHTAAMVKYGINSFLATKVTFFNYMRRLMDENQYETFTKAMGTDPRIGKSHMQVPGPDGHYGFGGKCLSKDPHALVRYAASIGEPHSLLREVITLNDVIRGASEMEQEQLEKKKAQG